MNVNRRENSRNSRFKKQVETHQGERCMVIVYIVFIVYIVPGDGQCQLSWQSSVTKDKVFSFGVYICDARMTVLLSILGNNLLLLLGETV